ncbi:hypothetical protein BDB00DRAFT_829538 [Zychaea mexicana]|uniref:uncharacterized protein n=1 Tax=Zychaea mexicana TaxID=64656 RepID=UPI0022FE76DB|nr:uncharacterized protein BDB00DRAFT_829538 [Zychaea mexicana]KAI9492178.1 hypothetical protein BDB00DRAFT_829538 [Zychaea mexicana]
MRRSILFTILLSMVILGCDFFSTVAHAHLITKNAIQQRDFYRRPMDLAGNCSDNQKSLGCTDITKLNEHQVPVAACRCSFD